MRNKRKTQTPVLRIISKIEIKKLVEVKCVLSIHLSADVTYQQLKGRKRGVGIGMCGGGKGQTDIKIQSL